jgi:hypothetical protein
MIEFQIFMTFSNKYNFDADLWKLFTGYLKKQIMFAITFSKATVASTPHVHSLSRASSVRRVGRSLRRR